MGYKVYFTESAKQELAAINNPYKKQISNFLVKLESAENPRLLLIPYVGDLTGYWKKRIGNYRIIMAIDDKEILIDVIKIGHRSKVYQKK